MKNGIALGLLLVGHVLWATENAGAVAQQKDPAQERAQLVSALMDIFLLNVCASHEHCSFVRGYTACLLGVNSQQLKTVYPQDGVAALCHLAVWGEKVRTLFAEAVQKKQDTMNLPTLDGSSQTFEIKLADLQKRVYEGEKDQDTPATFTRFLC